MNQARLGYVRHLTSSRFEFDSEKVVNFSWYSAVVCGALKQGHVEN